MITVADVNKKLQNIKYPGFAKSIIDFGFVKDVRVNGDDAIVSLEITSSANEVEATLKGDITKELQALGLKNITINLKKPQAQQQQSNSVGGKNIAPQIENFVMISSGKGGVGKSTTSVNLAIALAMQGKKVGLLDADIYGPNIPRMIGIDGVEPQLEANKVIPFKAYGIEIMSMGSLVEQGAALMWRGAMIMKAIQQFLRDILWSELDVLVIDMPPGTGDAQMTMAQQVPVTAGVAVTTPQTVAVDDAKRSFDMFRQLHIPIAGIIENMSGFICPNCGMEYDIFGKGAAATLAKEYDTKVLAQIPIEPEIRVGGDAGKPILINRPDSESAKRYLKAADELWQFIKKVLEEDLAGNEMIQPIYGVNGTPSACSMK